MSFALGFDRGADRKMHVPVMVAEVVAILSAPRPPSNLIVDATVGGGGHAIELLRATDARLLGIDRDAHALDAARESLAEFADRVTFAQADFAEISAVMRDAGVDRADAILADL